MWVCFWLVLKILLLFEMVVSFGCCVSICGGGGCM